MQRASRQFSDRIGTGISNLREAVVRFWHDETGTAAVLTGPREFVAEITYPAPVRTFRPKQVAHPGATIAIPAIEAEGNFSIEYQFVKRTLDILGSLTLLVMLSPVLLTVLVVLSITTRGKPLFSQERVGQCGRRFRMFKFRTMRLDADKLQHLVQNEKDGPIFKNKLDPRITVLGRWLRKTSIDELPQLVSVLIGHMSLVGPRPPVSKEVAKYKPWQRRRLAVKPGLTCLWQVSGRSDVGFEDWVRMDIWYVRNQSLWTDVKLLVRTPLKVITCQGAY